MKCKSCADGLRPEEEVEELCLFCAEQERDYQREKDWSNRQIDGLSHKHCPSCTCDESPTLKSDQHCITCECYCSSEYKPKHCPNCNAQVFCLECATEV